LGIAFLINRVAILIGLGDVVRIPFKKVTTILGAALQWLKAILTFVFGH